MTASDIRLDADWLVLHSDALELADFLSRGEVTSEQLVAACLRRIDLYDGAVAGISGLNSIIEVNPAALDQARERDAERARGDVRGPLHGIPVVIKDNYDTADQPTTAGCLALRDRRPLADATQVARLRDAGVVVIAKTNMDELASGLYGLSSRGGQTRNPYDIRCYPGGSSGGTGAAVAAGLAVLGLGSDTGGSIRIPAAHNGLVGLRTTWGLTSRQGICPESFAQDIGGPLTRSVRDIALVLDATAVPGPDPADASTLRPERQVPPTYLTGLDGTRLDGRRIGVLRQLFGDIEQAAPVNALIEQALTDLAGAGAVLVELPDTTELLATMDAGAVLDLEFARDLDAYLADLPVAPSAELAALAALTEPTDRITLDDLIACGDVTPLVQNHLVRRAAIARADDYAERYERALSARASLVEQLERLFDQHELDAVVYPSQQVPAATIGTPQLGYRTMNLAANSGWPALTVPAGLTPTGLPAGIEFLARAFAEPTLLTLGSVYEAVSRRRVPPTGFPALDTISA